MILFAWAGAFAHPSLGGAALRSLVLIGMLIRILAEEQELHARYKDQYDAYCRRVRRLIPGVF